MKYLSVKTHANLSYYQVMHANVTKFCWNVRLNYQASESSAYNKYIDGPNKKMGIIACGIGYNYLMENYPDGCEYPVLKIGQYPLPRNNFYSW